MESVCLGTMPVSERHTGDNISSWIEEILGNFGISTQKVVSFAYDNGSNFVCAGKMLSEKFGWSRESYAGQVKVMLVMICNYVLRLAWK